MSYGRDVHYSSVWEYSTLLARQTHFLEERENTFAVNNKNNQYNCISGKVNAFHT
jgi:hypothetical protein